MVAYHRESGGVGGGLQVFCDVPSCRERFSPRAVHTAEADYLRVLARKMGWLTFGRARLRDICPHHRAELASDPDCPLLPNEAQIEQVARAKGWVE
jgi:hypothetical protein